MLRSKVGVPMLGPLVVKSHVDSLREDPLIVVVYVLGSNFPYHLLWGLYFFGLRCLPSSEITPLMKRWFSDSTALARLPLGSALVSVSSVDVGPSTFRLSRLGLQLLDLLVEGALVLLSDLSLERVSGLRSR